MNPKYLNFSKAVDASVTDSTKRAKIIACAIARAVADFAPLPSSVQESPASYFNLQALLVITHQINDFNENVIFDFKTAIEYARAFWMIRFTAAHPVCRPVYSLNFDFFDSVIGVGTHVSPELHAFCNENKTAILMLSLVASELVGECAHG